MIGRDSDGTSFGKCLAFSNPTEVDMLKRIGTDGWIPIGFERTNLILFNWVRVNGITGAEGTYVGIAGGIFKLPWWDD
jgi:hypothetical protein